MDKILYDILENLNEGVVLVNNESNIHFLNNKMEQVADINKNEVIGKNIYDILPELNKNYFSQAINTVLNNGSMMFFSAAMHGDIIPGNQKYNMKISRIVNDNSNFLFIEFINVTSEFMRIKQLKEYISKLNSLNKELKCKEKIISNIAYYDNLTGLANRTLFYERAEELLNNARINNSIVALMFIDVNKFKSINDTYGHDIGDKVLINVADTLTKVTRNYDIVSRFGGDEFIIMSPYIKNIKDHKKIVSRIFDVKNKFTNLSDLDVTLSMGVSFYPHDGDDINILIKKADEAMYMAKKTDRKNKCCYSICI